MTLSHPDIINRTKTFVQYTLMNESTGHDYWHSIRVFELASHIAKKENVTSSLTIELAALLHDIDDWKFANSNQPRRAQEFLDSLALDQNIIANINQIINNISFKGALTERPTLTIEGQIVQDADRLDALGAIGIARTFAYGGHKNRSLYDPEIPSSLHKSFAEYKNNNSSTINHFHEKLLLLKDLMNTATAKKIASERHKFMGTFLARFLAEWNMKELI